MPNPSLLLTFSLRLGLSMLASFPVAVLPQTGSKDCDSADACLQQLRSVTGLEHSYTQTGQALVTRLLAFEPEIVPALVDILADRNQSAAEFAADALAETKHIDGRFLPQIKAGLDRGLGGLAPALCRMDGVAAAREAVMRFIASESSPHNQEAYALKICGRRVIPFIVAAARCPSTCGWRLHSNFGYVLAELGESRAEALPGLMEIVRDPTVAIDVARGVLWMVGSLGDAARPAESELLSLRVRHPELKRAIDQALIGMRSKLSGQIFVDQLAANPSRSTLRDLAEVGPAGMGAGSTVAKLLDSTDAELRIAAARTLGFIDYQEATAPLIRLLNDPIDARIGWVAAESLGHLQAKQALPALRYTAHRHWYPPVRKAALSAIEHIERQTPYRSKYHRRNFAFEFFDYEHMGKDQSVCENPLPRRMTEASDRKLYAPEASKKLKKLAYTTTVFSFGPAVEPKDNSKRRIIELTPDNMVEHRELIEQVPGVALRVDHGWLAGGNRGEWGGELVFVADDGSTSVLLNQNVEDIYWLGDQVVALVGLAHLHSNQGAIYAVNSDTSGGWSARPWRMLPGAPTSSWLVDSGEVLINLFNGGTILLREDGSFQVAPCADQ